jgi:glutamine amidotransferase
METPWWPHGGKELFWSTYKGLLGSGDVSQPVRGMRGGIRLFVNHFIVSSEPLQGENVWLPLEEGDVVGVDWRMRIARSKLGRVDLPLAAQ